MTRNISFSLILLLLVFSSCHTEPSEFERISEYSNSEQQNVVILVVGEDEDWKIDD